MEQKPEKQIDLENLTPKEKESIESFKSYLTNLAKFRNKGVASAAARARKFASEVTHQLKDIRKAIQVDKIQKVVEKRAAKAAKKAAQE